MSAALVTQGPVGPTGATGTAGAAGATGATGPTGPAAYTTVAAPGFTRPADGASVSIPVVSTLGLAALSNVAISTCGFYLITGIDDATHFTGQNLGGVVGGTCAAGSTVTTAGPTGPAGADGASRWSWGYTRPADSAAGDVTDEIVHDPTFAITDGEAEATWSIGLVVAVPNAAVTAHDTNYATITIRSYNGEGTLKGIIVQFTTKITGGSGNLAARAVFDCGSGAVTTITTGDTITVQVEKANGGVQLPAIAFTLKANPA